MKKDHPLRMIKAGRYTDFIRTQTLCQGGDLCDFYFVRYGKDEVWERTKSV